MSKRMKDWLGTIPVELRGQLIRMHTGSSLAYVMKKMFITPADQLPHFKIKIAVGLDKASRGALDFRDLVAGGRDIDWQYVVRELKRRHESVSPNQPENT